MNNKKNMNHIDMRIGFIDPLAAHRYDRTTPDGGAWETVTFSPPFPNNAQVIVFAQTQSYEGPNTPGLRIKDVTTTKFEVRMDEIISGDTTSSTEGNIGLVKSDGHHRPEKVGWIAIAT